MRNSGWMMFTGSILAFLAVCAIPFFEYNNQSTIEVEVVGVGIDIVEGHTKYLVFTKDGQVFSNDDSILRGKFNSSNFQAIFSNPGCYKISVDGFRIPAMSNYQNIYEVGPCDKKQ